MIFVTWYVLHSDENIANTLLSDDGTLICWYRIYPICCTLHVRRRGAWQLRSYYYGKHYAVTNSVTVLQSSPCLPPSTTSGQYLRSIASLSTAGI